MVESKAVFPTNWIHLLHLDAKVATFVICFISFCFSVVTIFMPGKVVFRAATALLFFQVVGIYFSAGKISHNFHSLILIQFLFIFLPFQQKLTMEQRLVVKFIIFSAQLFFVSIYFLAGVWKLRYFVSDLLAENLDQINPVAYNLALRNLERPDKSYLIQYFLDHPRLSLVSWILLIVFEISTILFPFYK
ncbi:MAG: hypothetical protein K2P98_02015, partial [Neisseriaceae bacterium]|nr:hypothetical protein [Neisseriaceae bacterium]